MLTPQQIEKFIYDYRLQIEALQALQTQQNYTINSLQQQLNDAKESITTLNGNQVIPANATDSYPVAGGILHKLKHTFQKAVTFASDVLIQGVLTLTNALALGQGGTGATTAAGARTNLGAAKSGVNSDITSLTGLSTPLPITEGGTGSGTTAGARAALSAAVLGVNGDITQLTGLSTALSVAQGGTAANNAAGARGNLGVPTAGVGATGTWTVGLKLTGGGNNGQITVNADGQVTAVTPAT